MSVFDLMVRVKNLLETFPHKSLKIGLENSINADDYPLIRVVPNANELDGFDGWAQDVHFIIYLGGELDVFDLEREFERIYALEREIFEKLHNFQWGDIGGIVRFIRTSRRDIEHFLMIECEYKIEGVRL